MYQATSVALARQFLRFAGAGTVSTALHDALDVGLVRSHLADVLTASAAGFAAGTLVSYGNHGVGATVVFRGVRGHRQALWRFLTVAAGGSA
jgi:putative flippase GtrA